MTGKPSPQITVRRTKSRAIAQRFKPQFHPQSIAPGKRRATVNTTPKNKSELMDSLKREKDFQVVGVHTGLASQVAKEVAKLGSKQVSVIVTQTK